jgi:hypothetical protein
MKFLIIMSLMLTSCGVTPVNMIDKVLHGKITGIVDPRAGCKTHPELIPYIRDFEEEYGRSIGDIPICLGDTLFPPDIKEPPGVVGVCLKWSSPIRVYKAIIIRNWWFHKFKHNKYTVRQLIEHELGHCALNRNHNDELDINGRPVSLMHPVTFSDRYYLDNYQYYLDELFNRL